MTKLFLSSETIAPGTDLAASFDKLMSSIYFRHRGCLVERTSNGFRIFGKEVNTMAGVDAIINGSINTIKKSI